MLGPHFMIDCMIALQEERKRCFEVKSTRPQAYDDDVPSKIMPTKAMRLVSNVVLQNKQEE